MELKTQKSEEKNRLLRAKNDAEIARLESKMASFVTSSLTTVTERPKKSFFSKSKRNGSANEVALNECTSHLLFLFSLLSRLNLLRLDLLYV